MENNAKKQWSYEETSCLLALWSSTEVQKKLDGASRTKPVFELLQREMAAAGHTRSLEQIINKLKKLKKEYRDHKKDLGGSGNGRHRIPHFDILDSVLGDSTACRLTGAPNSATAKLEQAVDDTVITGPCNAQSSAISQEVDELEPLSSSPARSSSSSTSSQQARPRLGKRTREIQDDLLEYMKRSDERFLQKMDADTSAMLGLIERMVAVMEASKKN